MRQAVIKKFVILLWFFVAGNFVNLRSESMTRYWAMLPDSILDYEKVKVFFNDALMFQKQTCEMSEKLDKWMEKLEDLKAMRDEIRREIERKKKLVYIERFDDTGLIRGEVKYFIRIWKHPPKEKFNMPIFK
ncbi:MAG: hypothetical protein ACK44H_06775 [Candidatus Kryptonium sp.]